MLFSTNILSAKIFSPDDDPNSSQVEDIFIIKGFQTIVFIFTVIFTTFQPICPPAFFECLSNSGIYTELPTTAFIESTGVACSDPVSHNWVQALNGFIIQFGKALKHSDLLHQVHSQMVRSYPNAQRITICHNQLPERERG